MATKPPKADIDEAQVHVSGRKKVAVGVPAVLHALKISNEQMGVQRSIQTLLAVNQKDGFDCPGCAWPEEDKRHIAEFCENGAKAVAEEATIRRVTPEFFAEHSIDELRGARRLVARPAGPADAPDDPGRGRNALPPDLVG